MVQEVWFLYKLADFKKTSSYHCVFVQKFTNDDFIVVLFYVDDMLVVVQHACRIKELKQELKKSFAMKDFGTARQILGMQIVWDRDATKLWFSQEKYIQKVLCRFNMDKAKVVSTPLDMHFKLHTRHFLPMMVRRKI